jgi:hypothetical protein
VVVGWLIDGGEGSASEQEVADKLGKAQRQHLDAVDPCCDTQQQVGDHCGEHLQPDCVVVLTKELADVEMLFDPAEQQFDLPAGFVERGDLDRGAGEIVGEKHDDASVVPPELDAAKWDRQSCMALADELDLMVGDDLEAVAAALAVGALLCGAKGHVHLLPCNEESLAIIDLPPPAEVTIAFVEDVSCTCLDRGLLTNLDVVDVGRSDLDAGWDVADRIVDDVQLHAANAAVPLRPLADFAERDRARIDQPHHLRSLAPDLPIGHVGQHRKGLRKNRDWTAGVGVRQRRAGEFARTQMIMVLTIRIEGRLQRPKAFNAGQLRVNQCDQMIPALEALVIGIAIVPIHNLLKLPSIDRF